MRIESDSFGSFELSDNAYHGVSSRRSYDIFSTAMLPMPRVLIRTLALIKRLAAAANHAAGIIPTDIASAISKAAKELESGEYEEDILPGVFQTGSGTATNMNVNEIIANRALEILGYEKGQKHIVHPNDHVNCSQSTNDTFPSAIRIASATLIVEHLLPELERLQQACVTKADAFSDVVKAGRTHLNDALPIFLGDEFAAFAYQIEQSKLGIQEVLPRLCALPLGGTAVGTGSNTPPGFDRAMIDALNKESQLTFSSPSSKMACMGAQGALVDTSGRLRELAVTLIKIANDIRWMAAGPRCNIHEIELPRLQPGSSIMPGKVNAVVCEAVMMASQKVCGNDVCIGTAGQHGNFQLNTMLPLIAHSLVESIEVLIVATRSFHEQCIQGIEASVSQCEKYAKGTMMTITALREHVGYDELTIIVRQAEEEGRDILDVAKSVLDLDDTVIERCLDPRRVAQGSS